MDAAGQLPGRKVFIGVVAAVGLVAVATGMSGCSADNRAAGCTPPSDEPGLLDQYAQEPALAVRPDGAQTLSVQRSEACHVDPDWPDDPTETAVYLRLSVPHRYEHDALAEAYQAVVTAEGWQPAPAEPHSNAALRYCKQIRGVTTYLRIGVPDYRPQVGVIGPGGSPVPQPSPRNLQEEIYVAISAAPAQPPCPGDGLPTAK